MERMSARGTVVGTDDFGAEPWVDSDWITVADRRYKVTVVPSRTPDWVVSWCSDGLVLGIVGLFVMWKVSRKTRTLAARVYWQRNRWYNGRHHRLVSEEFPTEHAVNARAAQFVDSLKAGVVPASLG
ncbi:hypothetical protein [Phycicoccus sp.]|uniref:hypothetical protein n=1 Tax=Phycicoccus sp. TaxID=1902410 RepID=UPI002C99B51D|nr:hypothetical protein [Phycicoccus sp.]HMM97230.1 hypothetical protein [Phycicoccus sp.]